MTARWGGGGVSRIRGFGVFFDKTGTLTPTVFTQFVTKFGTIPDAMVFFHLHPVEEPSVPASLRFAVSRIPAVPGCYRLVIRHGFMDEVMTPDLAALIYEQVRKFVVRKASPPAGDNAREGAHDGDEARSREDSADATDVHDRNATTSTTSTTTHPATTASATAHDKAATLLLLSDEAAREELGRLDRAYATKVMYVIGKEQMRIKTQSASVFRRVVLTTFLWIRENTRAKIANLRLAMDRVVEVGFVKEI